MYPCPYCHTQLTWVPQYNQYYCYFCHRYVQAAPPQRAYVPPYPAQAQTHATPQPPEPPVDAPRPVQVQPQSGAPANEAGIQPIAPAPANQPTPIPAPAKPSIEYVSKGEPPQPVSVPARGRASRAEPIYLCKVCGTRLEVNGQRWFCPRCQQYK
ncbi:MAG: hypothetical protein V1934_05660 [Methanobacteriota archaeon]